ncbi:MAG: hypothetical protein COU35_00690 [Candidatus Magasanikbacteria bacterium CG10_big_fil_rev_8_21_14_0_10_47_10]|uniref:DUF1440 domain-containing protein n=1 Tax=Candidatus Magasanikbacteria bacterium CG10_big_fil_rev_8_21_14_0_10_47_10 TaxID=1974652 RepID=A0A2H0TRL4_9BACT|nr:MAG: hypothetical protein COU35_00690 [Candidatus Magasanikbacteria bacterium CG10_big_fil_rev_8_21_14_0_10_47_10]
MESFQVSAIKAGIWGGLAGGAVFGIMMGMMGMLPMVALLIGSQSAGAGFIVHMIISAMIGVMFAAVLNSQITGMGSGVGWGLVYGAIWWVLGPLLIMPILLGMGPQLSAAGIHAALPSLWGHLIYGLILGFIFSLLFRPTQPTHDISDKPVT